MNDKINQKLMDFSKKRKMAYQIIGAMESKLEPKIYIPTINETAVMSDKPKTAALLYDRVWCATLDAGGYIGAMPDEIRFYGNTIEERMTSFQVHQVDVKKEKPCFTITEKIKKGEEFHKIFEKSTMFFFEKEQNAKTEEDYRELFELQNAVLLEERDEYVKNTEIISSLMNRDVANAFTKKYGRPVITHLPYIKSQSLLYQEGDRDVIIATLENLKIVDDEQLTWEQVLELRSDKKARANYKRFMHWLDKEMIGKSQAFIEDEIAIKLEDYQQALKKHGIKTILGTVKEMINSNCFLAGAGLTSYYGITDGTPLPVLIAGGLVMVSSVSISLAEKKLAFEECETGANSEISWVHEIKKKSKKE